MQTTSNYGLKKPENTDPVNIQDFNDNADVIDAALKKKLESGGNASDMTTTFSQASSRTNLVSEEAVKTSFGKIMKWFADLKGAAFAAIANNLTTSVAGSVLDATQGKVLKDELDVINSSLDLFGVATYTATYGSLASGGNAYVEIPITIPSGSKVYAASPSIANTGLIVSLRNITNTQVNVKIYNSSSVTQASVEVILTIAYGPLK